MSEAFTFTYCLFFQEFSNYLKSIFQKALEKKYSNLENFMIPLFLELHKMLQISSRHVQMYNTGHTFSFIVKTSLFFCTNLFSKYIFNVTYFTFSVSTYIWGFRLEQEQEETFHSLL